MQRVEGEASREWTDGHQVLASVDRKFPDADLAFHPLTDDGVRVGA